MKSKITAPQIVGLVCAIVLGTAIAHYDQLLPHRWQTYTAPDETFSVEFPGKPVVETMQVPAEGGGSVATNLITASPTSNTAYSCAYFTRADDGRSPEEVMTSARDGSMQKIQGTVIAEKRIEVGGYPGIETEANARGNSLYDSRIVLVGKRLYLFSAVASSSEDREPKSVKRFMDSIQLLKK